jgi:ribonucleoside-diphosphate reductase beta chain
MSDAALAEAIRRVETTPVRELVNVSVEDVQAQMDSLLNPELDSASFYHRWETQQWAVSDLDFSADKVHWANLPDPVRKFLKTTMTLFFIGEQIVTDTLAPVLHAAPLEDERIFLATQIADEARHTVFFMRFFEAVLGHVGGISTAMSELRPKTRAGYRRIFDVELVNAIDRCRLAPKDLTAFVEAVVTYHLIIEGFLALGGQRNTLRVLRRVGLLPGFVSGFTAVARDESRHIGFGVLALRRRVEADPEMGRVIARKILDLLEPAVSVVVGPDEKLPFEHVTEIPEPMRINALEARSFAVDSLTKRIRAAGLADQVVDEIGATMNALYERMWVEYEKNHGVDHPVRYWRELEGVKTA